MKSTLPVHEILQVDNLSVHVSRNGDRRTLIHNVSFSIDTGEIVSIVGESGSGKTTLACALTCLLPSQHMSVDGSVRFCGRDLLGLDTTELRSVLRSDVRYLFQEPGQSLNPIARIASQINIAFEQQTAHRSRCAEVFTALGLPKLNDLARMYPHELSIGMLQRILLAMALAPRPRLLIADEPTSAIDSLAKYQMMDMVQTLCKDEGLSVLFITHDLVLAERYAARIAVLADGRLLDSASAGAREAR